MLLFMAFFLKKIPLWAYCSEIAARPSIRGPVFPGSIG
jgi:hypothetical protein